MPVSWRRPVHHPGPAAAERIDSHVSPGREVTVTLAPGLSLLAALAGPMAAAGLVGAGVVLRDVRFQPFRYVMPAFAPDDRHVAYYSATQAPPEEVTVEYGTLTYGERDGAPFLHCHALWRGADGRLRGGHLLPDEAIISAPSPAIAFGSTSIPMLSRPDAETNFTLFRPVGTDVAGEGTRCLLARLKPGVDLVEGILAVCRRHGVQEAVVRSGVGSIAGAVFEDGHEIETLPTEIVVREGRVRGDTVDLSIGLIDTQGAVHEGRPVRGDNPVLICFELILEF